MNNKRKLSLFLSAAFCMLAVVSCQDNKKEIETTLEESQVQETALGMVMTKGMEENAPEDFYILYDASRQEYTTMAKDDYELTKAFANLLVRQD